MRGREAALWGTLGVLALAGRAAYVAAQPGVDPAFAHPTLDEAVYVGWAQALASGAGQPAGAFYLAPLYPTLLAGWALLGAHFGALYLLQQALSVATAGALAWTVRRLAGPAAGLAAGALALLYHPFLFFASRPLGETLALALLAGALAAGAGTRGPGFLSGALAGLSALARPNLGLVVPLWGAGWPRRAALLLAGAVLVILPVAARNWAASGHLVLVSSNGGMTLFHGNGPGALGVYTPAEGLSGRVERQREEATRLATTAAGQTLDPVEADAWWGRRALRTRAEDVPGTALLLARRLVLVLSTQEIGLDAAPALDANPWRWIAPLPFAALLALAAAAAAGLGFARTGGWLLWSAVAACAATPLVFYVSSRYRLPLAALLVVPAGVGLAALLIPVPGFRRGRAAAAGLAALLVSVLAPAGGLARACTASALSNRAISWLQAGAPGRAWADVERALHLDPADETVWFNAGVVAERRGDAAFAERAYRDALRRRPGWPEASGNLGALLVRAGRPAEAVPVLERALATDPRDATCWTNLVVALLASGRAAEAGAAAERARRAGVALDPGLLATLPAGGQA